MLTTHFEAITNAMTEKVVLEPELSVFRMDQHLAVEKLQEFISGYEKVGD